MEIIDFLLIIPIDITYIVICKPIGKALPFIDIPRLLILWILVTHLAEPDHLGYVVWI